MKRKDKLTPEKLILDELAKVNDIWYRSNERKADLFERKVDAYKSWANKVVLYILMQQRLNNENKRKM